MLKIRSAPARIAFATLVAGLCLACEGGGAALVSGPFVGAGDAPASTPWVGLYHGNGTGSVDGQAVSAEGVTLSIRLDADSVKLEACPTCMTVRMDTLFSLVNVEPISLVSLDARYDAAGVVRTLRLDRFSGGGGIGNVMRATLTMSGAVSGGIDFLLERR